jgi:hypothetical protein
MQRRFVSLIPFAGFIASAIAEYGFEIDFPLTPGLWLAVTMITLGTTFLSVATAWGQTTNSWTNTVNGSSWKWEDGANWSRGLAPASSDAVFITNVVNAALPVDRFKYVNIDAATVANNPDSMAIGNLMVANAGTGASASRNFLSLNNAGLAMPLYVAGAFIISNNATVSISNSVLYVWSPSTDFIQEDGNLLLNTGSLITTGIFAFVIGWSPQSAGQMTVQDGTWKAADVDVAAFGSGTLTLAGGTNLFAGTFRMGDGDGTGTVWVTGGQLNVTNGPTSVGYSGFGQMIVSNGTLHLQELHVSTGYGRSFAMAGGTIDITSNLVVESLGQALLTGGQFTCQHSALVGRNGPGQLAVSNGTFSANELVVADGSSFSSTSDTVVVAGGTVSVYSNLMIGVSCSDTNFVFPATVSMTGGTLYVTNATHTAALYIRYGDFRQTGGTLVADYLDVVDACGHFIHAGGTLSITATNIDPNISTAGDGVLNGWKLQYGLDPFDPNFTNEDADGDGCNNLCEYLSGTDPTNAVSALRIVSAAAQGDDMRIRWTSAGGHTNAIQISDGAANSSYSTDFYDLVWYFVGGSGDVTNQFLDFGAAAGQPSRFYRVRLVP